MIIRQAFTADIAGIQLVRNNVKENTLSDPALVPDQDVEDYINRRGRGWVALVEDRIVGFSIVSVIDKNIWALFMLPGYEAKGIGKQLHDTMLNWYFEQTQEGLWLSTSPGTRAETFYRKAGWVVTGIYGKDELKFEMSLECWRSK